MSQCRKRDNHVNGKLTAQQLGWARGYCIKAPSWFVNSYEVRLNHV